MILPQVLAVGYFEIAVNPIDGRGLNPIGGSYGIPVVNFKISLRQNVNDVDLTLTVSVDSIKCTIIHTIIMCT